MPRTMNNTNGHRGRKRSHVATSSTSSTTMNIQKQPPPLPLVDKATIQARAAAARAYALSSSPEFTTPSPLRAALSAVATSESASSQTTIQEQHVQQTSQMQPLFVPHIQDEDYARFVKSLVDDEFFQSLPMDDEDFDFDLDLLGEDEDDDDEDEGDEEEDDDDDNEQEYKKDEDQNDEADPNESTSSQSSIYPSTMVNQQNSPNDDDDDDDDEPFTLQAELGLLLEEDIEAAITTLLNTSSHHPPSTPEKPVSSQSAPAPASASASALPTFQSSNSSPRASDTVSQTPLHRNGTASITPSSSGCDPTKMTVTSQQVTRLKTMLKKHYQLLVQQAVLCVRSVQPPLVKTYASESKEDLVEILDGAIGMLQDLDQNRKDAIRTFIQLKKHSKNGNSGQSTSDVYLTEGRLTRAAFTRTLQTSEGQTIFDIRGLGHLKDTFATLDEAILEPKSAATTTYNKSNGSSSITTGTQQLISSPTAYELCKSLLTAAAADFDESWLPDAPQREYSDLLSQPKEFFGQDFTPPCSLEQISLLKRDRNQFTAAEDSLVFRGVNLYGEKQWLLIADRYLPDRSINIISQRYSKLSLMLYQAHGIQISKDGDLVVPPSSDPEARYKIDESALSSLKKVDPPAILNVHRWSIEEDLTLLKAVPVLGHMWAEVSTRLIPHRDRGHLRKRYQVLERRVKATVLRAQKEQPRNSNNNMKVNLPTATLAAVASPTPVLGKPASQRAPQFLKKRGKITNNEVMVASPSEVQANERERFQPTSPGGQFDVSEEFEEHESSRIGFEKILQDNDWSQMSKVKHILENDPPNSCLSGVNHLASAAAAMEREDHGNSYSSDGGLAMLAENVHNESISSPQRKPRPSILDSVLERAGNAKHSTQSAVTPSRRSPRRKGSLTTPQSSPDPRTIVSFSPAGYKGAMSPLKTFSSPGMSGVSALWGCDSMPIDNDVVDAACNFDISDRSRQVFGTNTPSKLPDLTGTGLTPTNGCHLLGVASNSGFGGHEMDVVKALNELSNSPARFEPRKDDRRRFNDDKDSMSRVKRSLFDAVVKGADRKKSKFS